MATVGEVRDTLHGVRDPELGVSIVDLGLVYRIEAEGTRIGVEMTLTTPSCPFSSALQAEVEAVLRKRFGSYNVEVTLVWEPHWTPDRMADNLQRQLGTQ